MFDISLWLKGLFALSEIAAGIAAFFVSRQFLFSIVLWVIISALDIVVIVLTWHEYRLLRALARLALSASAACHSP